MTFVHDEENEQRILKEVPADFKTSKIMHVDDDEDFLDLFFLTFNQWFDITSVQNPIKAIEMLKRDKYDVVVADFEMPEMNGLELIKSIKKEKIDIPVILQTGQGNEEVAREAFISGASDYFTKDVFGFAHKEKLIYSINKAKKVNMDEIELKRYRQHLEELVKERTAELTRINSELQQEIAEHKKSEEKYRSIFGNIQDIYFEISVDGIILELSPSIETVTSYKREELIGSQMSNLYINPDDRRILLEKMSENGSVTDYELLLRDKNGRHIPSSITAKLFIDDNGKPIKTLGTVRDITERKRIEKELKKYRENLEDKLLNMYQELSDFALRVSQDLKNPINLIKEYMAAIKENPSLSDKYFDRITEQTDLLIKFTDNLLKLSKSGKVIDKKERENPESIKPETTTHIPQIQNYAKESLKS